MTSGWNPDGPAGRDLGDRPLLVLDTATTRAVLAIARADGTLLAAADWVAGYRHGEELLGRLDAILGEAGLRPGDLGAIIVGTGPGAFTGLRVGIATAKGLAHAFQLPLVGVSTGEALLDAAETVLGVGEAPTGAGEAERDRGESPRDRGQPARQPVVPPLVLLQPAGPADRVVTRRGEPPTILAGGADPDVRAGELVIAVDLAGRAPDADVARGELARGALAAALLRRGTGRLSASGSDDLARVGPEYVTLPRGAVTGLPDGAVAITGRAGG